MFGQLWCWFSIGNKLSPTPRSILKIKVVATSGKKLRFFSKKFTRFWWFFVYFSITYLTRTGERVTIMHFTLDLDSWWNSVLKNGITCHMSNAVLLLENGRESFLSTEKNQMANTSIGVGPFVRQPHIRRPACPKIPLFTIWVRVRARIKALLDQCLTTGRRTTGMDPITKLAFYTIFNPHNH